MKNQYCRNIFFTISFFFLVSLQAVQRGHNECPICLTQLAEAPEKLTGNHDDHCEKRETVLLSCTHVFHLTCLTAFEELSLIEKKVCPVCRSGYQKRTL